MKIIRAERGIYVPHNPEKPDKNSMRLVQNGLLAIVPDEFELPEDSYIDMGKVHLHKKGEKSKHN